MLEEHEFVSEHEARQCPHMLTHNAEGTVTFSPPQQAERDVAGYAIKSVTHDWTWTYSGITAEEAPSIADTLIDWRGGELWTVEPVFA